jgi:hypothetical protein
VRQRKLVTVVGVRLPADERDRWVALKNQGGYRNLGDLLRHHMAMITQVDPILTWMPTPQRAPGRRDYVAVDPLLVRQLQWIGNNLNQLAHNANAYKAAHDAAEIIARLTSIQKILVSLRDQNAHQF